MLGYIIFTFTYMGRMYVYVSKALVSGSGSAITLIHDIVTSNAGVWLSNATDFGFISGVSSQILML